MKYLIYFLLLTISFSCAEKEKSTKSHTTYLVILDISGVRENAETREQYNQSFLKVVEKVKPGDALIMSLISENSASEPQFIVNKEFRIFKQGEQPNTTFEDAAKKKYYKAFEKEKKKLTKGASDYILNDKRISENTDIISSIHIAESIFKNYKNQKNVLIILSDMEEYSQNYNFINTKFTKRKIQEIIDKEMKSSKGMPSLDSVDVYVAGAKSASGNNFFEIKNFWLAYFIKCNANLPKENYGASLVSLK